VTQPQPLDDFSRHTVLSRDRMSQAIVTKLNQGRGEIVDALRLQSRLFTVALISLVQIPTADRAVGVNTALCQRRTPRSNLHGRSFPS
jgi:hypothetical protein